MNTVSIRRSVTYIAWLPVVLCTPGLAQEFPDISDVFIAASVEHDSRDSPPTLLPINQQISSDKPVDNLIALGLLVSNYLSPFVSTETGSVLQQFGLNIEKAAFANDANEASEDELLLRAEEFVVSLANTTANLLAFNHSPEFVSQWTDDTKGIAAFALLSFLNAVKCRALHELVRSKGIAFAGLKDEDDNSVYCEIPRVGKIVGWNYRTAAGAGADSAIATGDLVVEDMKIDRYDVSFNSTTPTENSVNYQLHDQLSYEWHLSVGLPGYDVSVRRPKHLYLEAIITDPDADPFLEPDPRRTSPVVRFPALPDHAKDVSHPESIWARNLTLRVFAHGLNIVPTKITETRYDIVYAENAGEDVTNLVVDTETGEPVEYFDIFNRKFHRKLAQAADIKPLDKEHVLMNPSEFSCIDIMFDAPDVPATRADFPPTQEGWCLGRCQQPVIANSR